MKISFWMTLAVNAPRLRAAVVLAAALLFVLVLDGCSRAPDKWEWRGSTMGTTYSVVVSNPQSTLDLEQMRKGVEGVLQAVNASMSTYIEDSELSRINQNSTGEWLNVSPDLLTVLEYAMQVGTISGGAYDITIGPLVNLWGFGPGSQFDDNVPLDADIISAKQSTGQEHLLLQGRPGAVKKKLASLYIDLSSIAKGFGVDQIGRYLEEQGLDSYLVEIGGELRARGVSPRGDSWKVAVEKPQAGEVAVQRVLDLENISIATSGDYKNYFEKDGKRYSHTIDARTGRPVTHRLTSVSVASPSALEADAWATAFMVLGEDAGYDLAQRLELPVYFIFKTNEGFETRETPQFTKIFGHQTTH